MEQKSVQSDDNPLLDLIYINLNLSELINNANNCLKKTEETEAEQFIIKFNDNMQSHLKKYEQQNLKINENISKQKKIKYLKSQNEFLKKNELNDFILTEFISKYLPDIITKILNTDAIITKYLSQTQNINQHIIEMINIYNLILKKDMIEINKNKKIIADDLLQISTFEKKENKLKINNKNLKDELNKTKLKLNNQIDEQKKNFLGIVNNKEELLKKTEQDNKKLNDKIKENNKKISELQINLYNLETKYKDIKAYNYMLISNESYNGALFNNYINSIEKLNGEINDLNNKIEIIKIENIELNKKVEQLNNDKSHLKNELTKISKENVQLNENIRLLKNELTEMSKENIKIKNQNNKLSGEIRMLKEIFKIKDEEKDSEILSLKISIELITIENKKKYEELEQKIKKLSKNNNE